MYVNVLQLELSVERHFLSTPVIYSEECDYVVFVTMTYFLP